MLLDDGHRTFLEKRKNEPYSYNGDYSETIGLGYGWYGWEGTDLLEWYEILIAGGRIIPADSRLIRHSITYRS
jgi:hypothetical protein